MYDYEADGTEGNGAVEVANSATNFPVGCKFIMEILGADKHLIKCRLAQQCA